MDEKEKLILDFMRETEYVPMKAKEMAAILMVPKKEYQEFQYVIKKLENEFKIQKNKKNQYEITKSCYQEGIYQANEKGYGFVTPIGKRNEEIYIAKENHKDALNGDLVWFEIIKEKESNYHAEGKIKKVLKHDKNVLVGIFEKSRNFAFVIPDDKKFGSDIFISKKNFGSAKNQDKVVVKIIKYPERNKKVEGKIIEVLGNVNEAGVDMMSLIKEYRLPYEFPEGVLQEAKKSGNKVEKKDIPNRKDLRDNHIFTIDGETAKDLDDAICISKNADGNFLLDVHIADVSYYVREGTLLDKEALLRGTSIYMLDRVIPMLPPELSNGICSLNQGEDRFTLSISMEIDKNGNVISSEVYKAIICVKERMTYTNVQKILDGLDKKVLERYNSYIKDFKLMKELAIILKKKRIEKGYLNLEIPESNIILDEKGHTVEVKKYKTTLANEIIEQFMLTANETIAEKFYWLEAPFIYRVHEDPDLDKIAELNKFLYNFGYKVKMKEGKIYSKEFSKILEEVKGKPEEKIISNFILHTLKVAKYESENKGHFGIASKYYCHFTSPIRRYPDLFIHRMISKYLKLQYNMKEEEKLKYKREAEQYAKESSERENVATKVERESIDMKKAEYMADKIGEEYMGIISNITAFGMFVELENTVEGLIRFENLGKEYFIYDDEHKYLIGENTHKVYKIGDSIKIRVIDSNKELRRIGFEKVEESEENE